MMGTMQGSKGQQSPSQRQLLASVYLHVELVTLSNSRAILDAARSRELCKASCISLISSLYVLATMFVLDTNACHP